MFSKVNAKVQHFRVNLSHFLSLASSISLVSLLSAAVEKITLR